MKSRQLYLPFTEEWYEHQHRVHFLHLSLSPFKRHREKDIFDLNLFMEAMATVKGKAKVTGNGKSNPQFTEFVNVTLPAECEDDLEDKLGTSSVVYEMMSGMLSSGYRIGFSYDERTEAVICSLTCRDEDSPNSGKTMTSFAGDWYEALRVSLYKHCFFLQGEWVGEKVASARPKFG